MLDMDFTTLSILMMTYSFMGWFYESTLYSLCEQGKLMNRGCFIGPYCPIYAVVVMVSVWLLQNIKSPVHIVLIAGLIVTMIEYISSYALEKLFHARYWDYSAYPLNINGRVSLPSSIFFGFAALFAVRVLHPFMLRHVSACPFQVRLVCCIIICVIFFSDMILTTIGMINLNKKCKQIYDMMDQMLDEKFDSLNEKKDYFKRFAIVSAGKEVVVTIKGISRKFVDLETHFLRRAPQFRSTRYSEIVDKMKLALNRKERKQEMEEAVSGKEIVHQEKPESDGVDEAM